MNEREKILFTSEEAAKCKNQDRIEDARYKALDRSEEARHKSLDRLYEYTKFHIGVYISLTTAYIAFASAKVGEMPLTRVNLGCLLVAVLFFMLAGFAGGVIISSITQTEALTSQKFLAEHIGPWDAKKCRMVAIKWTWFEHTSFWLGVFFAILSLVLPQILGTSCVGAD